MVLEIISAAVNLVGRYTVAPMVNQLKYVLNYSDNKANLSKEVEKLNNLKLEIEVLVLSAQRNAEDIKPVVETWIAAADQTTAAATRLIDEESSQKRCFVGPYPNPFSRHRFSRKMFKETAKIARVQIEGKEFKDGSVSFPVSVPSSVGMSSRKDWVNFDSRLLIFKDIVTALKDPSGCNVIGVYGMGGLGKTTLVKQVAAQASEEFLFDEVVMPIVTQKNVKDVKEFQDEMAKVLGMRLHDRWNVSQRAQHISKRLTQKESSEKRILIILDDLRSVLDLEQVGIPYRAGHKGSKILLTSRFLDVSYADQKVFQPEFLNKEEAWRLFQNIAGDILKDTDFLSIGKEVADNCKGLPVLIVTVAGALSRYRSLRAWKDSLRELERLNNKEMEEFVNSALEFVSYKHLHDTHKSMLLLCGLVGGGEISVYHDLLKLGMGWGLFEDTTTMEEARNKLDSMIIHLKASYLLLDSESVGNVRMHDVVRDVAIKIAMDQNMLLRSSEEWPEDDMLKKCTALTFPYGIIPNLPECLECPSLLRILFVYHSNSSLKIPGSFFEKMKKLRVLRMTSMDLCPTLPSSLSSLQNLQTLCLSSMILKDISIVGELVKLKILSINNVDIVELPMEIGQLSDLRVLDLYGCSKLKVIFPGVIQCLSRLEELHIVKSFVHWEVEGIANSQRRNASLAELKHLLNLTTLELHIPDAKLLPRDFYFNKLEKYTILIGDEVWDWRGHDEDSLYNFRGMKLKFGNSTSIHLESRVKEFLKRIEILYLDEMRNIHELGWDSFLELKYLNIQHSAETQYIVNAMYQQTHERAFPAVLESLFLSHLTKLKNICIGQFKTELSFGNLKVVNVSNCKSLRNLFSYSMARGVPHLQEIKVTDCEELEAILEDRREDDIVIDKLMFCQLRRLSLKRLPKLKSFCSDEFSLQDGSTSAMPFFNEKVSFPGLEELTLSEIPHLTEIWPKQLSVENMKSFEVEKFVHGGIVSFSNVIKVTVKECGTLKYLFTHSITMGLGQVQEIKIKSCELLKEIVAKEEEATNDTINFSQLSFLLLENLPSITRFCSGSSIVFPTLTELQIHCCQQLETFLCPSPVSDNSRISKEFDEMNPNANLQIAMQPLFNEKVEFPCLKELSIQNLDNIKTIWHSQQHEDSFCKLEQVIIRNCANLLTIFPSTMMRRIQSLRTLWIINSCSVEEVFQSCAMVKDITAKDGESTSDTITISQLSFLLLENLPKLTRFCLESSVASPTLTELQRPSDRQLEPVLCHAVAFDDTTMNEGVKEMDSDENILNPMLPLFNGKVTLPSLKNLVIDNLDSINIIWHSELHENSFYKLEEVTIRNCPNLVKIFPSSMLTRIQSLKKLWIENTCLIEEVFDAPRLNMEENADVTTISKLRELYLDNLPKLKCVWSQEVIQIISFKNLSEVDVRKCQSLKYVFLGSMDRWLYELKELTIKDCGAVETIFNEKEGVETELATFMFYKLAKLCLDGLAKLKFFYPGKHTIEWPSLKELDVDNCEKVNIFDSGFLSLPVDQFKEVISNLEFLTIGSKDMMMIMKRHEHFPPELFHNLKWSVITKFDESAVFPSEFLERFHNLKRLSIYDCSFHTIFPYKRAAEEEEEEVKQTDHTLPLLPQLTVLKLYKLLELKYIWKEDWPILSILEKLEALEVWECTLLTSLVPCSISFKLLNLLDVQNCEGLVNLVQFSTAKSLVLLKKLKITECKRLKEIVAASERDEEGEEDEIIFSKLKSLELGELPSLINFCPANYILKFPSLEKITVRHCPNMRTFCPGIVSTPELQTIHFSSTRHHHCSNNLNTIIQQAFLRNGL